MEVSPKAPSNPKIVSPASASSSSSSSVPSRSNESSASSSLPATPVCTFPITSAMNGDAVSSTAALKPIYLPTLNCPVRNIQGLHSVMVPSTVEVLVAAASKALSELWVKQIDSWMGNISLNVTTVTHDALRGASGPFAALPVAGDILAQIRSTKARKFSVGILIVPFHQRAFSASISPLITEMYSRVKRLVLFVTGVDLPVEKDSKGRTAIKDAISHHSLLLDLWPRVRSKYFYRLMVVTCNNTISVPQQVAVANFLMYPDILTDLWAAGDPASLKQKEEKPSTFAESPWRTWVATVVAVASLLEVPEDEDEDDDSDDDSASSTSDSRKSVDTPSTGRTRLQNPALINSCSGLCHFVVTAAHHAAENLSRERGAFRPVNIALLGPPKSGKSSLISIWATALAFASSQIPELAIKLPKFITLGLELAEHAGSTASSSSSASRSVRNSAGDTTKSRQKVEKVEKDLRGKYLGVCYELTPFLRVWDIENWIYPFDNEDGAEEIAKAKNLLLSRDLYDLLGGFLRLETYENAKPTTWTPMQIVTANESLSGLLLDLAVVIVSSDHDVSEQEVRMYENLGLVLREAQAKRHQHKLSPLACAAVGTKIDLALDDENLYSRPVPFLSRVASTNPPNFLAITRQLGPAIDPKLAFSLKVWNPYCGTDKITPPNNSKKSTKKFRVTVDQRQAYTLAVRSLAALLYSIAPVGTEADLLFAQRLHTVPLFPIENLDKLTVATEASRPELNMTAEIRVKHLGSVDVCLESLPLTTYATEESNEKSGDKNIAANVNLNSVFQHSQALFRLANHPFVISPLAITYSADGSVFLVTKKQPARSLVDVLDKRSRGESDYPLAELKLLECIAMAVYYLHKNDIVLGDLSPTRVLVSDDGNPVVVATQAFRLGAENSVSVFGRRPSFQDSVFVAPEIRSLHTKQRLPTRSGDIWSFGCLIAAIVMGKPDISDPPPSRARLDKLTGNKLPQWIFELYDQCTMPLSWDRCTAGYFRVAFELLGVMSEDADDPTSDWLPEAEKSPDVLRKRRFSAGDLSSKHAIARKSLARSPSSEVMSASAVNSQSNSAEDALGPSVSRDKRKHEDKSPRKTQKEDTNASSSDSAPSSEQQAAPPPQKPTKKATRKQEPPSKLPKGNKRSEK